MVLTTARFFMIKGLHNRAVAGLQMVLSGQRCDREEQSKHYTSECLCVNTLSELVSVALLVPFTGRYICI